MKNSAIALFATVISSLVVFSAQAADIKLYPTGPAEDSAFLRFVNATESDILVKAADSGTALELSAKSRATPYMPVAGKSTVKGELSQAEDKQAVVVEVQPGEFVTVLGVQTDQGLRVHQVHEEADGFTAVRASIAFYDLNESCQDAAIQVAGQKVFLFEGVEVGKWVRRQVNPVPLSVQLVCAGKLTGQILDLGILQAGERYSLFLTPGDPASNFFHIKDAVAN